MYLTSLGTLHSFATPIPTPYFLPILLSSQFKRLLNPFSAIRRCPTRRPRAAACLCSFSHPAYAPRGVPVPVTNRIPIFQYLPGFCCRKLPTNTTPRVFSTQSAPNRTTSSFRQSAILDPNHPMTSFVNLRCWCWWIVVCSRISRHLRY